MGRSSPGKWAFQHYTQIEYACFAPGWRSRKLPRVGWTEKQTLVPLTASTPGEKERQGNLYTCNFIVLADKDLLLGG